MKPVRLLTVLVLVLALSPLAPAQAGVYVGVGCRPRYYGYYRPYYYGYPPVVIGVGVGPVIAPPPTVVVAPPVTVVQPGYGQEPPLAAPAPPPTNPAPPPPPQGEQLRTPPVLTPTAISSATPVQNGEIDRSLQQLSNPDQRVRANAMIELGRLKASQAIQPLQTALASDTSPVAREAAARALGLIGASSSLDALQMAAQADDNHDVRNSARFAADVIRSRMPR